MYNAIFISNLIIRLSRMAHWHLLAQVAVIHDYRCIIVDFGIYNVSSVASWIEMP